TADLVAPFLLELPRVGTFTLPAENGSGRANFLSADAALTIAEAVSLGAAAITFRRQPAVRLPRDARRDREARLLEALTELTSGAKKALHYGNRTPALVAALPMTGGVNPLTFVVDGAADGSGLQVSGKTLRQELSAWEGQWEAPVRLGWRPGFQER